MSWNSGATAIVILENFAVTLAEVIDSTAVQHVVMASMGDLLGFWYGLTLPEMLVLAACQPIQPVQAPAQQAFAPLGADRVVAGEQQVLLDVRKVRAQFVRGEQIIRHASTTDETDDGIRRRQ